MPRARLMHLCKAHTPCTVPAHPCNTDGPHLPPMDLMRGHSTRACTSIGTLLVHPDCTPSTQFRTQCPPQHPVQHPVGTLVGHLGLGQGTMLVTQGGDMGGGGGGHRAGTGGGNRGCRHEVGTGLGQAPPSCCGGHSGARGCPCPGCHITVPSLVGTGHAVSDTTGPRPGGWIWGQ